MSKEIIKEIKEKAAILQKSFCAYGTIEGDGQSCDCKFSDEKIRGGEDGGCAEARSIMWNCDKLATAHQKEMEALVGEILESNGEEQGYVISISAIKEIAKKRNINIK